MSDSDITNESTILTVFYYIFAILMIIFSSMLIYIYSKDKYFQRNKKDVNDITNKNQLYLTYFNIFFCIIIVISNLVRIIPSEFTVKESETFEKGTFLCLFQAFVTCLLDKILLTLMTNYSIINYLSMFKPEFYKQHIKRIYIILISVGFTLSLILSIIFICEGVSYKDVLCSIHTRTVTKKIVDGIFTCSLLFINVFCLGCIILNLYKLKKKYTEDDNKTLLKKSSNFLFRYTLDLIITIIAFTYTLLVINKAFPRGSYKDFIYLFICLLVELFFTINESLYHAFIRLVTCGKYYKLKDEEGETGEAGETGETNDMEENFNPTTEGN